MILRGVQNRSILIVCGQELPTALTPHGAIIRQIMTLNRMVVLPLKGAIWTECRSFAAQEKLNKDVDHYSKLGVHSAASRDEIKRKFHELAKRYHPDSAESKASDEEYFKQITAAYDILSNEMAKRSYDAARKSR